MDPPLLVLEITESVLMQDREAVGKELADASGPGRARGDRRLRHRLLGALLPARVPDRHGQDGPVLREGPRRRRGRCGARALGGGARRGARHADRGRGDRAARTSSTPSTAWNATSARATSSPGRSRPRRSPRCSRARPSRPTPRSDAAQARSQRITPLRSTSATRASRSVPTVSGVPAGEAEHVDPAAVDQLRLAATT